MQEALPYKRWEASRPILASASPPTKPALGGEEEKENVLRAMEIMVKENPVIIVGKQGCCMCHVVRKLLLGLGVNPLVLEVNAEVSEHILAFFLTKFVENEQHNIVGNLQFPIVFVGGRLFGGLDKVMATHISGELVPILKQAGALWL